MDEKPLNVYATAVIPVLIQIVTKLLVALGAFLVTHGLMTEDQVAGSVGPIAQEIVGVIVVFAAATFAALRTKWNNDKLLTVKNSSDTYVPDSVLTVKGESKNA